MVQAYISCSRIIRFINKSRYSVGSYLTRIVRLRRVFVLCTESLSNEHLVIFTYASGLVSDSASTIKTNACLVAALMKLPIVSYNAYHTNVKAFDYFRQPVVYIEHGHIYTRRVHGKLCSRVIVCTRPCGYGAIRPDHRDIGWFGRTWNVTHRVTKICLLAGGQTSWQLIQKHHYRLHAYRQVDWRDRYCNATRRFQRVSMYPSTNVPTHSAYAFPISMYAYIACLRARLRLCTSPSFPCVYVGVQLIAGFSFLNHHRRYRIQYREKLRRD